MVVAAPTGLEPRVADLLHRVRQACAHRGSREPASVAVVTGGSERQQSVALALDQAPDQFDIVLVHDAARALTPAETVEDVARAVRTGHDAVIPVLPVVDTITRVDGNVSVGHVDRAALRAVQTPQGFRRRVLAEAHDAAAGVTATDDAGLVARLGVPVHTVPGSALALKITTPADLAYAETLLAAEQH